MFGMLSSYIPAQPVPGVGRISGTAWSLSDLLLGGWGGRQLCMLMSRWAGVHLCLQGSSRMVHAPCPTPPRPSPCPAGVALAGSNTLAGRLSDLTIRRGLGGTGCFFGAAAACLVAMLALVLLSTFGDLGREDLVAAARTGAA